MTTGNAEAIVGGVLTMISFTGPVPRHPSPPRARRHHHGRCRSLRGQRGLCQCVRSRSRTLFRAQRLTRLPGMYAYCIDTFGCPIERTNVNGGGIALGTSLLFFQRSPLLTTVVCRSPSRANGPEANCDHSFRSEEEGSQDSRHQYVYRYRAGSFFPLRCGVRQEGGTLTVDASETGIWNQYSMPFNCDTSVSE